MQTYGRNLADADGRVPWNWPLLDIRKQLGSQMNFFLSSLCLYAKDSPVRNLPSVNPAPNYEAGPPPQHSACVRVCVCV